MTFQVLFAITAFFDLDIEQMDDKTAFLYSFIDQLVYINILKKLEVEANCNIVYKLLKTFYSLKKLLQLWYKSFLNFLLQKLGFLQINTDHSIFVTKVALDGPLISIFVDNIKIMALKESRII